MSEKIGYGDETKALHVGVTEDVLSALAELKRHDTPSKRRTFIRVTSSGIEVLIHIVKTSTLENVGSGPSRLSPAELAMLREEGYSLSKSGQATTSVRFLPTAENFRFAVETFMRSAGVDDYSLDVSGPQWQTFKNSISVRNRIVHPRSVEDFDVSDAEVADAEHSFVWATKTVIDGFVTLVELSYASRGMSSDPHLDDIRSWWNGLKAHLD